MERVPLSNKSGLWFEFNRFVYLVLAFIVRPLLCKRIVHNPLPIRDWDDYYIKRKQMLSLGDYSVPLHDFGKFSTYCYTLSALCAWEDENHVWWDTTNDEQSIQYVKYLNRTWASEYRLLYSHSRNRIYELLGIGND